MHLIRRIVAKNVTNNTVVDVESNTTTTTGDSTTVTSWTIPNSPVPYPENTNRVNTGVVTTHKFSKPQSAFVDHEAKARLPAALGTFHLGSLHLDYNNITEREQEFEETDGTYSSTNSTTTTLAVECEEEQHRQQFHLFFQLPCELQLHVLQFINPGDLYSVQLSCKSIHNMTLDNLLWKSWTSLHFQIDDQALIKYGREVRDQWRQYYKTQTLLYNNGEITSERILNAHNRPNIRFAQTGSVIDNKIYYIGGQMEDKRSDEIISFDATTNTFSPISISNYSSSRSTSSQSPAEISGDCKNFRGVEGKVPHFARHQSVAIGSKIYVFGGYDYHYFYNLAIFDPILSTWTYPTVYGDIPSPRSNHSSAVVGSSFYIFGGSIGDNIDKYCVTNDFYCFNTLTFTWTKISRDSSQTKTTSVEPTARVGHVMTALGKYIYMFGGGVWGKTTGWTEQYNDLYIFDTETKLWECVELAKEDKPSVCSYPYVCSIGLNVMLFGGASMIGSSVTNKMYVWNVMKRKWKELVLGGEGGIHEISARSIGTANRVFGAEGQEEIVIWGGYCGGLLNGDNDLFKFRLRKKEKKNEGSETEAEEEAQQQALS